MHQRIAGLRGVEHGTDRAHLGHRQHADQQLRPVLDEYRHTVALADALGQQVMGDAIGLRVDLCITQHRIATQQRRALGIASGGLFETPAQATRLGRVQDIGQLHALDDPGNGSGDGWQLAQHHAPGNGVAGCTTHGDLPRSTSWVSVLVIAGGDFGSKVRRRSRRCTCCFCNVLYLLPEAGEA